MLDFGSDSEEMVPAMEGGMLCEPRAELDPPPPAHAIKTHGRVTTDGAACLAEPPELLLVHDLRRDARVGRGARAARILGADSNAPRCAITMPSILPGIGTPVGGRLHSNGRTLPRVQLCSSGAIYRQG